MSWVLTGALVVGGLASGKAKHDKEAENEANDRKIAGAQAHYSWATGMPVTQQIHRAGSEFGDELQGAVAGAQLGQGIKAAGSASDLAKRQQDLAEKNADTWAQTLKMYQDQTPKTLYGASSLGSAGPLGVNTNLGY